MSIKNTNLMRTINWLISSNVSDKLIDDWIKTQDFSEPLLYKYKSLKSASLVRKNLLLDSGYNVRVGNRLHDKSNVLLTLTRARSLP